MKICNKAGKRQSRTETNKFNKTEINKQWPKYKQQTNTKEEQIEINASERQTAEAKKNKQNLEKSQRKAKCGDHKKNK